MPKNSWDRNSTRRLLLVGLVVVGGCGDLFGPPLPSGAVPLDPIPEVYSAWWSLTERCSGITGDFSAVRWYTAPAESMAGAGGKYRTTVHEIVLSEGLAFAGGLVRHEILHALLRSGGHPRKMFMESCADIVSCVGACLKEAGGAIQRDSDAPFVEAHHFRVSADVVPATIRQGGCASVVIAAHNADPVDVRVRLPPHTQGGFHWSAEGVGGGSVSPRDSVMEFLPGEVRRYVYDCFLWPVDPGVYAVRGHFQTNPSDPVWLTVRH